MNEQKKDVSIRLKTIIADGKDQEVNELQVKGSFFQKGNLDVLNFTEKIETSEINTLITIQQGKIAIKRSGAVSMHQRFHLGQATETVYKHPHGNIHMETFTKQIHYRPLQSGIAALLALDYAVKLNGQDARNHRLELLFEEDLK